MTNPLDSVLTELEQFGKANDASTTERPRLMLNITRDTGLRRSWHWSMAMQYRAARGSDLPLSGLEVEVLPPVDPDERPKGMAEGVLIPVVPALLNAIHDATGHRFQSLPVTQALINGALK